MLSLNLTLRVIATVMLLIIVAQFAYTNSLQLKPFIAANVLFFISIIPFNSVKKKAFICLLMAVIIPIGAFQGYVRGEIYIEVVVVYIVMFTLLGYAAVEEIRNNIM